jgi:hypothetical protein
MGPLAGIRMDLSNGSNGVDSLHLKMGADPGTGTQFYVLMNQDDG